MSQPYICATCRLRPLRQAHSLLRTGQRQWLSQTATPGQESQTRTQHRRDEKVGRYSRQTLQPHQVLDQLDGSSHPRNGNPRQQRRPDFPQQRRDAVRSDFRDGLISQEKQAYNHGYIPPELYRKRHEILESRKAPPDDLAAWRTLQEILRNRYGPEDLENLGKERMFSRACFFWMKNVCENWAKKVGEQGEGRQHRPLSTDALPSPVVALKVLTALTPGNRSLYCNVLWTIATAVAEIHVRSATDPDVLRGAFNAGLQQLMAVWSVCMAVQLQREPAEQAFPRSKLDSALSPGSPDWSFLPNRENFIVDIQMLQSRKDPDRSFSTILAVLLPPMPPAPQGEINRVHQLNDYASAAFVTMDLIEIAKAQAGGAELVKAFAPWQNLLDAALKHTKASDESERGSAVPPALTQKCQFEDDAMKAYYRSVVERRGLATGNMSLKVQHHDLDTKIVNEAPSTTHQQAGDEVENDLLSLTPSTQEHASSTQNLSATDRFAFNCMKRLGRATEQEGLVAAETVRKRVQHFNGQNPDEQLPIALYESLMYSFLSLRSFRSTVDIWNEMLKAGHVPTCKTYTVMMRGCSRARDFTALEGFWSKMRQASIQPDHTSWSVRIHGLLRLRKLDTSLPVLREMGQEWVTAARANYHAKQQPTAKGKKTDKSAPELTLQTLLTHYPGEDVDGVPRPNVTTMNSAVSSLAASDDSLIPKVLSWGRSFGIEPDTLTYNALVNISMRHGNADEALNLLKVMKQRGIQANQKTWTVLLTAIFETDWLGNLDPQEQESKVIDFIDSIGSMEGAKMEQESYALIMDRVLKMYNNPSAAAAVLDKMISRGMRPNAHIYTILMTSYFDQQPPNFAAVEALWNQIQSAESGYAAALDTVFFDRMIESYARHHQIVGTTAPMLEFLDQMQKQGKRPSWRALESVARALADAGEWERLAKVVGDVRRRIDREGPESRGYGSFGQQDFWQFVIDTGILRDEGIVRVEQVMLDRESDQRQRVVGRR